MSEDPLFDIKQLLVEQETTCLCELAGFAMAQLNARGMKIYIDNTNGAALFVGYPFPSTGVKH